jgi:TRAP-type C4-dicarboxylate transport system permease small subunit
MAFLAVLAWGSLPLLRMGTMQTSSAMHLPMWIIYSCLPAGAFYIALELLVSIVRRWRDPFPAPSVDEPDAEAA